MQFSSSVSLYALHNFARGVILSYVTVDMIVTREGTLSHAASELPCACPSACSHALREAASRLLRSTIICSMSCIVASTRSNRAVLVASIRSSRAITALGDTTSAGPTTSVNSAPLAKPVPVSLPAAAPPRLPARDLPLPLALDGGGGGDKEGRPKGPGRVDCGDAGLFFDGLCSARSIAEGLQSGLLPPGLPRASAIGLLNVPWPLASRPLRGGGLPAGPLLSVSMGGVVAVAPCCSLAYMARMVIMRCVASFNAA